MAAADSSHSFPPDILMIKSGTDRQPDVRLERFRDAWTVVKDYRQHRGWRRLFGWWVLARENAAYRHLQGCSGVPKYFGKEGALCLRLGYVEGKPAGVCEPGELPDVFFERLQALVVELHGRGVAHNDLKRKRNILVTPNFDPVVIDFAASWWRRPGWNPFRQWLFRRLCEIDFNAIAKLKKQLAPHLMTAEDRRRLEEPTLLERLARKWLNR